MAIVQAKAEYETERTAFQINNWLRLQGVRYKVQVEATMPDAAV
jgi:hypothetical protein